MTGFARSSAAFAALVLSFAGRAPGEEHGAGHGWSYEGEHGPAHWGALRPEYAVCKTGKHQSPIDILPPKTADLPAIDFSYAPVPFHIVDNGHTVQVDLDAGNFVTVAGKRYDLVQFHFHRPSEERVNGRSYPMVTHLVHKNADGKLAVVAVLLETGQANPAIETLWKIMPAEVGQKRKGAAIDVRQLLPDNRGYYTFAGSLTTPPCSEDVTWLVLKNPTSISTAQEAAFASKYPHNARPVQPLNGRPVQASR